MIFNRYLWIQLTYIIYVNIFINQLKRSDTVAFKTPVTWCENLHQMFDAKTTTTQNKNMFYSYRQTLRGIP